MNISSSSGASRRQIIKGAAWSAPVIIATTAIPAYAASYHDFVANFNSGWTPIKDLSGSHTGTTTYLSANNDRVAATGGWYSGTDTRYTRDSKIAYAQYEISYTFDANAGEPIEISYPATMSYANNRPTTSLEQRLDVLINGQVQDKISTRAQAFDYSQYYPTNSVSADTKTRNFTRDDGYYVISDAAGGSMRTFTYTPTTDGPQTITLRFWKAVNPSTTSNRLSNVSPYDSTNTNTSGNDKLTIGYINFHYVK